MRILITGTAGFIGYHAAAALLQSGHTIKGIDSLNSYYDPRLKQARLEQLSRYENFTFEHADTADAGALTKAAGSQRYDVILHLAAQAGVRHALADPDAYTQSNLVGQANVLELARHMQGLQHLVYASSSSVYGNDTRPPFSETARADRPISYYGATKRAAELMTHSYSELFGLRATGLRFFTVYGPWGRPDMAYWMFTDAILNGKAIKLFGDGQLRRDFTWIGDIVPAILAVLGRPPVGSGQAPHQIYNLGNSKPENVNALVYWIEQAIGRSARVGYAPGPAGDVRETYADITLAKRDLGFNPRTTLEQGIGEFVRWFRQTWLPKRLLA